MSSTEAASTGTTDQNATTADAQKELEAEDVACSVILRGLGQVPFASVMLYDEDPKKMWSVLHERSLRKQPSAKPVFTLSLRG